MKHECRPSADPRHQHTCVQCGRVINTNPGVMAQAKSVALVRDGWRVLPRQS